MKFRKKFLVILVIFSMFISVRCFAFSKNDIITYNGKSTTFPEIEDSHNSEEEIRSFNSSSKLRSSKPQENISDLISKFEDGDAAIGIDVSKWQGDINWTQVAESGVKFAMIRAGYRGVETGTIYKDEYFEKNIQGALNNGIYVGVYFYSAAINEEEAIQEAAAVLELVNGYDIKYPIAYDFEEYTPRGIRTDNLTSEQMNKNAQAFLGYIKSKGYQGCLYGSASYLKSTWKMSEFSEYSTWVAHYYVSKPSYTGKYDLWQCTDNAIVPGITTGAVDVDIDYSFYFKYNNIDITNYMFDSEFYADKYPDLKSAYGYNSSLLKNHYELCGKKEGRMATPAFDVRYYLNKYPDLRNAYGTNYEGAYEHFVNIGIKEGRIGSRYFNVRYYLNQNRDLKKAFYSSTTRALEHFIVCGIQEGRVASDEFNVNDYRNSSSKYVKKQLGASNKKYIALADGGSPINDPAINITNYVFDYMYYADNNSDLKAVYGYDEGALRFHYEIFGIKEGRNASNVFDPKYYLEIYPDLKSAFGDNYALAYNHFINYGIYEGRKSSNEFDVIRYINNYSDLEEAFGTNYSKALEHYVLCGRNENRIGN